MPGYVHVLDVIELGRQGFDQVRELTGMWPCTPATLERLPLTTPEDIERAAAHMLEKIREHGEPVRLLVPCEGLRSWPHGGSIYAMARYGDLYCERVNGLSCGSNTGGALALLRLLAMYTGAGDVKSRLEAGHLVKEEHRDAVAVIDMSNGKALIIIYKLEPP